MTYVCDLHNLFDLLFDLLLTYIPNIQPTDIHIQLFADSKQVIRQADDV